MVDLVTRAYDADGNVILGNLHGQRVHRTMTAANRYMRELGQTEREGLRWCRVAYWTLEDHADRELSRVANYWAGWWWG